MTGWLDGVAHEPGANAGYKHGRNGMEFCGVHDTAGACAGDRAVGLRGYFNLYVPKAPECGPGTTQFAEVDAVTWHMCEWNRRGTSIEVEKRKTTEDMTDYQIDQLGRIIVPQLVVRGIELRFTHGHHDLAIGAPISGFVDHQAVVEHACEQHEDFWKPEECARIEAIARSVLGTPAPVPAPSPSSEEDDVERIIILSTNDPTKISNVLVQLNPFGIIHQYSGAHVGFGLCADAAEAIACGFPHQVVAQAVFEKIPLAPKH